MLHPQHSCIPLCIIQMKVYAEAGGKPHTWDVSQRGTITPHSENNVFVNYHDSKVMELFQQSISTTTISNLCLTEYTFVSISLVLIISKFFPVYHSKLVSKATTQEYKSLYWGAAVVSNCFTLGLLFPTGRAFSIVQLFLGRSI